MKIIDRNSKGYYKIDNKDYLSVTTLMDRIFGMGTGLVKNYFIRSGIVDIQNHVNLWLARISKLQNTTGEEYTKLLNQYVHLFYEVAGSDRQEKADYGTWIHNEFYKWRYKNNEPHKDIQYRVFQIKKIYDDLGLIPLHGEQVLWSNKLMNAGKCDDIEISRKFKIPQYWFIDYKSGSAQRKKELLQISAYAHFAYEIGMIPEESKNNMYGLILHVGRNPTDKVFKTIFNPSQMQRGFKAYTHLSKYYKTIEIKDKTIETKQNK